MKVISKGLITIELTAEEMVAIKRVLGDTNGPQCESLGVSKKLVFQLYETFNESLKA